MHFRHYMIKYNPTDNYKIFVMAMAIGDRDMLNIALEWKNNGRKVAIATVIQT